MKKVFCCLFFLFGIVSLMTSEKPVSSLSKAIGCGKEELETVAKKENIDFKNPTDDCMMTQTSAPQSTIYHFTVKTIEGEDFPLSDLKGKKIMIVNVASKCGLTPQYAQLQELYEEYKDKNFVIIGFPANNFGAQEQGSNEEIKAFCTANYGVTFPMMAKISVKGEDIAPLYRWLTVKTENGVADGEVTWNFQKFLIDEQGRWVKSIAPKDSPKSEEIMNWLNGD
jgi:glutathione peroxidase